MTKQYILHVDSVCGLHKPCGEFECNLKLCFYFFHELTAVIQMLTSTAITNMNIVDCRLYVGTVESLSLLVYSSCCLVFYSLRVTNF